MRGTDRAGAGAPRRSVCRRAELRIARRAVGALLTARSTVVMAVAGTLVVLAVPLPAPRPGDTPTRAVVFAWDRDAYWRALESAYTDLRAVDCATTASATADAIAALGALTEDLDGHPAAADAPLFDRLETGFVELAPAVAACPAHLAAYVALFGRLRAAVKWQSRGWDVRAAAVRDRLYRSLYGGRAAVEEALLQHPGRVASLLPGVDEPSGTPSAEIEGVRIHSGDIVVSRGGYPTSALIARGNDYPGNFSHVALVHVDDTSHVVSVIEAHIERGVAVSPAAEYLRDKKLRLLVLRPRADLPALAADPLLPHRAASRMLARARAGHIPYDFAMDYADPSRLFCSEVASSPYRDLGITLWTGISTISAPGLRRWLASFGVRHFETQEPSDLEYDPQLVVVAEWHDPVALAQDHIDNAVVDAMLEGAERGDALSFPWYRLPAARLLKAYSWVRTRFGATGPIPEGMGPAAALRHASFSARQRRLAERVRDAAGAFEKRRGYWPPYWVLLDLAREAAFGGAGASRTTTAWVPARSE